MDMDDLLPAAKRFKDENIFNSDEEGDDILIAQLGQVPVQVEVPPEENPDSDSNANSEMNVEKLAPEPESEQTPEPEPVVTINLGEDVLFSILSCTILGVQDLLNCRLVNRTWWNVATSTLFKRDISQVSLEILHVPIPSSENIEASKAIYCQERNNNLFLEDLIQVISTSAKFPCSSFQFVSCLRPGPFLQDLDPTTIKRFFELCGTHIKTLCVGDLMLEPDLTGNLIAQACNLEFLDIKLQNYFQQELIDPDEDNDGHGNGYGIHLSQGLQNLYLFVVNQLFLCKADHQRLLPRLHKLRLDHHLNVQFDSRETLVKFLEVAAAARSNNMPNGHKVNFLKLLRQIGKSDLVKELRFIPSPQILEDLLHTNVEFKTLAETKPKLSKLEVNLRHIHDHEDLLMMESMVRVLNEMLESSKDSLTELHFHFFNFKNQTIKVPRFTKLKCLKLTESCPHMVSEVAFDHLKAVEGEEADEDDDEEYQGSNRIIQFWRNRSRESFCSLEEVHLDVSNYGHDGCLMLFFHRILGFNLTFDTNRKKTIVFDYLDGVRSLEIYYKWPTMQEARNLSEIFLWVKHLKLKCLSPKDLSNSLWVMCPTVESIEIYGMSNESRYKDNFDFGVYICNDGSKYSPCTLVDSFFTGIPIELCKTLRDSGNCPKAVRSNSDVIDFLRAEPSICALQYLKDFKIFFTELNDVFASEVSGTYALKRMPQTKFTFVHTDPIELNETECDLVEFLKPISTYVTLIHQKMPERFGGWIAEPPNAVDDEILDD